MHWADRDDKERQQGHQRRKATEEHRPAYLFHCFYDGLLSFTVYAQAPTEIRKDVDVVGDGDGKGQDGGNHQYGRIDIHLRPPRDAVGDEESAHN